MNVQLSNGCILVVYKVVVRSVLEFSVCWLQLIKYWNREVGYVSYALISFRLI